MNEWTNEESWMRGQQTCPLTIHFKMWTVSTDVSIQRRRWQPLSVHLWAYCTHPTHDANDVMCEGWPQHLGSESPTLFEQWCGFFYVPQEPGKCKCCETGPTVFRPYARRLESLTVCRYHYKGSTFFSVFREPECWSGRGSNTWPPDQQIGALPTEPTTLRYNIIKEVPESLSYFLSVLWKLQYWKSLFLRAVFTYKLRRQRFLSFGTVEEGRI